MNSARRPDDHSRAYVRPHPRQKLYAFALIPPFSWTSHRPRRRVSESNPRGSHELPLYIGFRRDPRNRCVLSCGLARAHAWSAANDRRKTHLFRGFSPGVLIRATEADAARVSAVPNRTMTSRADVRKSTHRLASRSLRTRLFALESPCVGQRTWQLRRLNLSPELQDLPVSTQRVDVRSHAILTVELLHQVPIAESIRHLDRIAAARFEIPPRAIELSRRRATVVTCHLHISIIVSDRQINTGRAFDFRASIEQRDAYKTPYRRPANRCACRSICVPAISIAWIGTCRSVPRLRWIHRLSTSLQRTIGQRQRWRVASMECLNRIESLLQRLLDAHFRSITLALASHRRQSAAIESSASPGTNRRASLRSAPWLSRASYHRDPCPWVTTRWSCRV